MLRSVHAKRPFGAFRAVPPGESRPSGAHRFWVQTSLALMAAAAACGGDAAQSTSDTASADSAGVIDLAVACADALPVPAAMAVLDFIGHAEPQPLRFLNAVGTDSALPPAAEIAVQDKGPTFYWLEAQKNQDQIREKLSRDGPWATMLVLVRENTDHGDGTHSVRVGGRYIANAEDGVESPEKLYRVACQVDSTAAWVIKSVDSSGAN